LSTVGIGTGETRQESELSETRVCERARHPGEDGTMIARTLCGRRLVTLGRPSKRDESTTNAIVEAIRGGASRREAARAGGISKSTLMTWMARGRDGEGGYAAFLAAVRQADRTAAEAEARSPEERLVELCRPRVPEYARLSRTPDLRARRLARKRAGRPRPVQELPRSAQEFPIPSETHRTESNGFRPPAVAIGLPNIRAFMDLSPLAGRRDSGPRTAQPETPIGPEMSGMSDEKKGTLHEPTLLCFSLARGVR
jgi:hypothetical protein